MRLVDLLPLPSLRVQRIIAFLVVLSQAGISVTGAVVRVTSSGLGCPTWPTCFPGSFTPVPHAAVPFWHQAVEFSNRMAAFVVTFFAALVVLAVLRARRRGEVVAYAWLMPGGTVLQAVLGGITVRAGLLWWTVSIHLLASMLMVWLSVLLFAKIGEPDDGIAAPRVPAPLRWLTVLSAVALTATLVAGTFVTGAGPHAGDESVTKPVARLKIEIVTLVHAHAEMVVAYLALIIGLGFGLAAVGMTRALRNRLAVVIALVCAQGLVGIVQYFTHVPAALVAAHVGGAAACTAATAALWAAMRTRESITAQTESQVAHAS
ncbi:heme A synthase [Nocardia sp. NEAU-G5]|uniref:Heme A synthase n=2 Tax=Nocardiaceae TaxID=85025 RepID=A0ABS6BDS1_9NOCA|nr:heme A synthase [Nocardia albiluteola]